LIHGIAEFLADLEFIPQLGTEFEELLSEFFGTLDTYFEFFTNFFKVLGGLGHFGEMKEAWQFPKRALLTSTTEAGLLISCPA